MAEFFSFKKFRTYAKIIRLLGGLEDWKIGRMEVYFGIRRNSIAFLTFNREPGVVRKPHLPESNFGKLLRMHQLPAVSLLRYVLP